MGKAIGTPSAGASAFAEALVSAAKAGLPEPAPDPRVAAAFGLGWQIAVLYRPEQRRTATPAAPDDLPSVGRLSDAQVVALGLDRVQVAVHDLQAPIHDAGLDPPDIPAVRAQVTAAADDATRRAAIGDLHLRLNSALGAMDLRLGKAYGIGRALADTCRNPATLADLRREFAPERIATLASWLDDLASALPAHAAHSVRESVRRWSEWAAGAAEPLPADALALLRRQGDLWRALLAGEKVGADMLEIDDYLDAGERLAARLRDLGLRFARRFPVLLAIVVILFVGGIVLVLVASSSASVVAGIGGVLASIGIGWRGAGATLGRALGSLERPLWGAELDVAITDAITLLPGRAGQPDHAGRRTLARQMAGHAMKEPHA